MKSSILHKTSGTGVYFLSKRITNIRDVYFTMNRNN